jgi:hypothetical protein
MIAHLDHPGPVAPQRWAVAACDAEAVDVTAPAGETLVASLAEALADYDGAWLMIENAPMARLDFVIPGVDPTGAHAAWYAGPHRMGAGARIVRAGLHLGWRQGARFAHIHGHFTAPGWQGPTMGHLLPMESRLAGPTRLRGFGLRGAALHVALDDETGFPLFQPRQGGTGGAARLVTLRPNQDIGAALVQALPDIPKAQVFGLGSLIHPKTHESIDSFATEILLTGGRIDAGQAVISADIVTLDGQTHSGTLQPGANAVCVTAELLVLPLQESQTAHRSQ